MDTADLISARFWEGEENHVAVDPSRPGDAEGLAHFARTTLDVRGWCFFQTSGSEGLPKWVALTKEALLISARAVNTFFSLTTADRWLVALPVHHVGGFAIHARCFAAGSSAHRMAEEWDPASFAALCAQQRATVTSLVPTQLFDLAAQNIPAPPGLRAAIIGGGALSPRLQERARDLGWPVCASYGMTEAASQIATQRPDEIGTSPLEILPHWETNTDGDGVLTLRGAALAKGYASRGDDGAWRWQEIDSRDGLRTRDRVRVWHEGARRHLEFIGRDASFIKICGELVNRDALQRRLDSVAHTICFQSSAVLCPVDDMRRGTTLVIVVEGDASSEESRVMLRERFNAASLPFERANEVRCVAAIPRTALGKPRLTELAAMVGGR